jgi:hypothetical protein
MHWVRGAFTSLHQSDNMIVRIIFSIETFGIIVSEHVPYYTWMSTLGATYSSGDTKECVYFVKLRVCELQTSLCWCVLGCT